MATTGYLIGTKFIYELVMNGAVTLKREYDILDYINKDFGKISLERWQTSSEQYVENRKAALLETFNFCDNLEITNDIIKLKEFMIGQIITYAGVKFDESKWMSCDGRLLKCADYPELYEAIGTTHNEDNTPEGSFNLPDSRDRVLIGYGGEYGLGQKLGEKSHVLTVSEMPKHSHNVNVPNIVDVKHGDNANTWQFPDGKNSNNQTSISGEGKPHNNMQPSLCVWELIRYKD